MYTHMDGRNGSSPDLPPGFRFHPTDEELIVHYLRNQAMSRPCPISIIPEVDIYKFDPWELPDKAEVGEKEWYFFTPRDRKYPNGVRPNRATISGYWKATGTDKAIQSGPRYVGVKKALVFYHGKPPKGVKTDWIMHEYRVTDARTRPAKLSGSMRLDEWVLCRIYKRKPAGRTLEPREEDSSDGQITAVPAGGHDEYDHASGLQPQTLLNLSGSTSCSLPPLMEMENVGNVSQQILTADNSSFPTTFDFQNINIMGYDATGGTHHRGVERQSHQLTDASPYHVMMNNHTCSFLNQPIFANPVIDQYP